MQLKLTKDEIQLINALDSTARITAKYCCADTSTVTFLVKEQDIGQAIGRNGSHIKKLRERLRKNVEIIPFTEEPVSFLQKTLAMFKVEFNEIEVKKEKEKMIAAIRMDLNNKEKMLRNIPRLKRLKKILKNYFEIENIKLR